MTRGKSHLSVLPGQTALSPWRTQDVSINDAAAAIDSFRQRMIYIYEQHYTTYDCMGPEYLGLADKTGKKFL